MADGCSPSSPVGGDATLLLQRVSCGDRSAADALLPLVYEELRARAGAYFRGLPPDHTLQPTALVHDAYVRMIKAPENQWRGRDHFCAVAATAMRQILTNHARRRVLAQKAKDEQCQATLMHTPSSNGSVDLIALDDALKKLADRNQERARLVELRFFGGLTVEQTASVLEVSVSSVEREWRRVRAWLRVELGGEEAP